MVEAHSRRGDSPVSQLHAHVGAREDRGGQAYEGRERDQKDVEGIDEKLLVPHQEVTFTYDLRRERAGGEECDQAHPDVQIGGPTPRSEEAQQEGAT